MNEQSTLNISQQAPTAARVPQNTATPPALQGTPDQGPSSFSQALKSANGRMENASSANQSNQSNNPVNTPATKAVEANEPATTDSNSGPVDPASQAPVSPAALALSTLQSMLGQTGVPPTTPGSNLTSDIEPDDTTLALAAQQAVALTQAVPTANIAVTTANNKEQAASSSASQLTDPLVTTRPTSDALDAKDGKDLTSLATKLVTGKDAATLVAENLKGKDLPRETSPAPQHANSFASELNNAQMAFGVKPEMRADSPQTLTQHAISTPVTAHNWADEVGQRLNWVANKDNGRAELILNPPHMGKIEVSINLNGDQASASFTAANQATRDAIQDAMPRLREVLADAGIQLGQANVSAGNSGQAQADQYAARNSSQSQRWLTGGSAGLDSAPALTGSTGRTTRGNGLVDLFA